MVCIHLHKPNLWCVYTCISLPHGLDVCLHLAQCHTHLHAHEITRTGVGMPPVSSHARQLPGQPQRLPL